MRIDALKPGDVFVYLGAEAEFITFGEQPVQEFNIRNRHPLGEGIGWLRLRYLHQQGEREWPERGNAEVERREHATEHDAAAGHGDRHLLEDAAEPVSRAALPESSGDGEPMHRS